MSNAPIQLITAETTVPMEIAAEAYKEHVARYGSGQSLVRICQRGGWSATELATLLFWRIQRLEREQQNK